MSSRLATDFQKLSRLEKLLAVAAFIAFPVDLAGLFTLLAQVINYFKNNGTLSRPTADDVGLPPFIWDSRLADVLSLAILLYSLGVFLYLLYRRNVNKIHEEQIKERTKIVEYYTSYNKSPDTSRQSPIDIGFDANELQVAGAISSLTILPLFLFLSLVWLKAFVMVNINFFLVSAAILLGLLIFSLLFLSARRQPFSKYYYDRDYFFLFNGKVETYKHVGLLSYLKPVFHDDFEESLRRVGKYNLLSLPIVALLFDPIKTTRSLLLTAFLVIPLLIIALRSSLELQWTPSIISTILIVLIIIPLLWGILVAISVIIGISLVFLFNPNEIQPGAG